MASNNGQTRFDPDRDQPTDWWVYKAFDGEGRLLYVGMTRVAWARFLEHQRSSGWTRMLTSIEVEHYPTERQCRDRERDLIKTWQPPFNIAMVPGRQVKKGRRGKLHPFPGNRRIPPAEVERLAKLAEQRGQPIRRCACGCGEPMLGRRPQTKWATEACRKRAARRAV